MLLALAGLNLLSGWNKQMSLPDWMSEIEQWCDKVILVNCGTATVYDDVKEGIEMYKRICS